MDYWDGFYRVRCIHITHESRMHWNQLNCRELSERKAGQRWFAGLVDRAE